MAYSYTYIHTYMYYNGSAHYRGGLCHALAGFIIYHFHHEHHSSNYVQVKLHAFCRCSVMLNEGVLVRGCVGH